MITAIGTAEHGGASSVIIGHGRGRLPCTSESRSGMTSPAIFTDLYELTMLQAYFEEQMSERAVFSLFVRSLPPRRNFLLACGLEDVLTFLETVRFDQASLQYLSSLGRFSDRFLSFLEGLR